MWESTSNRTLKVRAVWHLAQVMHKAQQETETCLRETGDVSNHESWQRSTLRTQQLRRHVG
jgi:hypothetical protein